MFSPAFSETQITGVMADLGVDACKAAQHLASRDAARNIMQQQQKRKAHESLLQWEMERGSNAGAVRISGKPS